MATKDNKAVTELRRLTECCICLMPFTDPRMLPCIHSACFKCFEDIQTKNQKNPGDVIPCPECRKEFTIPPTGMSGLQKNFFIANLLEIVQNFNEEKASQQCKMCKIIDAQKAASEVTMKCLTCRQTFCERCANVHKFNDLTQSHRIAEINAILGEEEVQNCSNHPHQILNYYCGDCKAVVCGSCVFEKHKLHDCKDLTTVDRDFRKSLENSSTKMLHYISQLDAMESKMESKKMNLLEQTSEIEKSIRLKNEQLKAMIDQHTELVLNELSSRKQKLMKNIVTEIEEIERQKTILHSFETYCSEIRSKGSPTDVCSCIDELIRRADELGKENDEYISQPDSVVEFIFNANDQNALIRSSSNVIGKIEVLHMESTERVSSRAIFLGGSHDGNAVSGYITKINLQSGDVLPLQELPFQMKNKSAGTFFRNSVYITGIGNKSDEIWKFNATSDKWKKCASMAKGRRRHSVAFVDQFLYICGGYVSAYQNALCEVEAYDSINNRCSIVGKLVHRVQNSGNCVPFKSLLYIFGGRNAENMAMNHVQVYDTGLNTCTLLSHPMPIADSHVRAALLESTVILLSKDSCFLHDLDTGAWQERSQFKTKVDNFGMIIDNGQIFVFGGGIQKNVTWDCRESRGDIRCVPLKNVIEGNKAIEWRHHANLPRRSLVDICEKI